MGAGAVVTAEENVDKIFMYLFPYNLGIVQSMKYCRRSSILQNVGQILLSIGLEKKDAICIIK